MALRIILCSLPMLLGFTTNAREDFGELLLLKDLYTIKNWSTQQAKAYYPDQRGPGEVGDAYRHVLASVISRKVVGRTMASSAGWVNELMRDVRNTNTPQDRFMDLHNNRVGRHSAYQRLIGATWKETAQKVKAFMDDESNRLLCDWGQSPPTKAEAKAVHQKRENRELYLVYVRSK